MKELSLLVLSLIIIIFIAGCTQQPTGQAVVEQISGNQAQPSQVSAYPCANVICSDHCSGNTRLINGYCVGGKCMYYSDYCENGCTDGHCNPLTTAPTYTTTPNVNRVGSTVEISGLKITLNNVRTDYHIGTYYTYLNQYQNEAKDGYKYFIVSITVENTGSESKYVLASDLTMIDSNKNQYEYSSATYSLPNAFESKNLLSNAKNSGEVAFEVPENAPISKLYYEIDNYNEIYAIWDLSVVNITTQSTKECGNAGQSCCDNQCSRENICSGGVCIACGKDNQPPCSDGCYYGYELIGGACKNECSYGQIRVGGVCQDCGKDNQIPCSDGCDYGYELISGKCISECGYGQIRINGVCTNCGGTNEICCPTNKCDYSFNVCNNGICIDCGGLNEPCCSDSKCDYSKVCKNNVCVNCGSEAGQPCCLGETKCLSFPTTTCISDVCQYCGRTGEICCEGNKCNSGQICKNGFCEECGSTGQQCCGPENYYICFIGSCQSGICVYP